MKIFKKSKKLDADSMTKGVHMTTVATPSDLNTEQFNTIRTNIEFSNIDDKVIKTMMITSSTPSEGKSTVSANLAVAFAKQGKKVALVDSDLRRPTINATFSISNPVGLTNYLTSKNVNANSILYKTSVNNLYVIPSGPIPPNPSELIGSLRMKKLTEALKERLDLVIYDAPPLLSVTDSQILSTRVDGTILIIRENHTEKQDVKEAVGLLKHVKGRIIGSILNDVKQSGNGYYGYYS